MHDELATVAESCLDLKRTVKEHSGRLSEGDQNHKQLANHHTQLRTDFDKYVQNQELERQRTMLQEKPEPSKVVEQETIERLQVNNHQVTKNV